MGSHLCYTSSNAMQISLISRVLLAALCLGATGACAQSAAPVLGAPGFSAEPWVVERWSLRTAMNADGTGTQTQTLVLKLQSDAAVRQFGVISLQFAANTERAEFVYARARHADGTVTETPLAGVQEQPAAVTREAPFYSDLKQAQLPVRNLQVGDTLEWQSRVTDFQAEAPGNFWGQGSFLAGSVVLAEDFELSFPADKTVEVWTNPALHLAPAQATEGGRTEYRWHHAALAPTVGAAAEAEKARKETTRLTADEELTLQTGALPDIAWTTFSSWAAVGAWYRALEGDRALPDEAVKAKVAQLTAGKTTTEEKVRAVYTYVSLQIRYIGIAFGVGRYQPHAAGAVLDNQYGDCKDKHTLLSAMLTVLGLHPEAALVGAGLRFNAAVPSPLSFNHLITRVQVDGKDIWLDSTAEVAPYRLLLPLVRDKQALVIPDAGVATVQRTPEALPFAPFATLVSSGSLDKDLTSDSQMVLTFHGDDEVALRALLRTASAAQYDDFVQRFMAALGYGGTTSQPAISAPGDPGQPLTIAFHYRRAKDAGWGAQRIAAQFLPFGLPFVDASKPPVASLQLGVPRTETSTIDLKLPDGWTADLPDPVHAHSIYATCDVTYSLAKGTLHEERRLAVLKTSVPVAEWQAYKSWYDAAGASSVPFIQLHGPAGGK